jgi:hypothetical protein
MEVEKEAVVSMVPKRGGFFIQLGGCPATVAFLLQSLEPNHLILLPHFMTLPMQFQHFCTIVLFVSFLACYFSRTNAHVAAVSANI